jgi:hypothetical protein
MSPLNNLDLRVSLLPKNKLIGKELLEWSFKKWLLLSLIFISVQVVFFALLLNKEEIVPSRPSLLQHTEMVPHAGLVFNPVLLSFIESFDPRIYSYAHPLGVSAYLWEKYPTTEYTLSSPSLPPLTVAPDTLFFQRELSNLLFDSTVKKDILENIYSRTPKIREPFALPSVERSTLQFPQEVLQYWFIPEFELPVFAHPGAVAHTELSAILGEDGRLFSVTLISSCGIPSADEQAVQRISSLRLLPLRPKPAADGSQSDVWTRSKTITLTVNWATTAPPQNNRIS